MLGGVKSTIRDETVIARETPVGAGVTILADTDRIRGERSMDG